MDDGEHVEAARGGSREAFGELVERHQGAVHGLCLRMTGNILDAEELAHEAFVEAWLKLAQLRRPERFGPWLRRIALNLCRAYYRRRRRQPLGLGEDHAAAEEDELAPSVLARMSVGLSGLSPAHRMVLVLHYFEGLSYEQTAAFLDVPVGTVMSRLHRARAALKRRIEQTTEEEGVPVIPTERFREEVDAEIAVLLEMFDDRPDAAERLSVILGRSPERFARLLREGDETTLGHLAVLLPHLGSPAVQIALGCLFADDAEAAARAGAVLRGVIARGGSLPRHGWQPATPNRGPYVLLDRLIETGAGAADKAAVLLDWLDASDDAAALLVANVLLCYREAALPLLMERFRAFGSADDLYASADVLRALCRTGTPFCRRLAAELAAADPARLPVVLAAVEALARCLNPRPWLAGATEQRWANEVRTRRKWPPLRPADVDADVVRDVIDRTAALVSHDRPQIRESALRALGLLRATDHAAMIAACASHEEPSTRLAALRALADMGAGPEALLSAAEAGPPAERLAAVEALGRLRLRQGQPLLMRLAEDPDARVRGAAVIALGELGGEQVRAHLRQLLRRPDNITRKAAAKALYRGKRTGVHPTPSAAARKLRAKIRGDARPHAYASLDTAVRFALPEMRAYDEREITRRLAGVCIDHSLTRRLLVDCGLMTRAGGVYELTDFGRAVWRVEHFIMDRYLLA